MVEWTTRPGLLPYPEAMDAMRARVAAIREGSAAEQVWLVEHPPLYTSGTSAEAGDLVAADRFPTYAAGRGGQWTYHGPGQRTAYVMLDISRPHGRVPARDVRAYVAALEAWVIAALATFGVVGERREGRVGVWVAGAAGEAKVAAVGVRVTRWVTWHGVAVNVDPDLSHYAGIVPCGVRGHGVTSLAALGVGVEMAEVDAALRKGWAGAFG